MNKLRIRSLSSKPYNSGPVVYWMSRDQRINYNWALHQAIQVANVNNTTLSVIFSFNSKLLIKPSRHYIFMLNGLSLLSKELNKLGINFEFIPQSPETGIPEYLSKMEAGYLISDFSPLKNKKHWNSKILEKISIPFDEVDTHNIVPVWVTSTKQEFAARTIRPKIQKQLPMFLDDFILPKLKNQSTKLNYFKFDQAPELPTGEKAASQVLNNFITSKLAEYDHARNNPTLDGQSNLSPYLHFGQISAQQIAKEVKGKKGFEPYLEELIIRKELSDNYCFYNENYDNILGAPEWATKELDLHSKDIREFTYTYKEFELAKTHDSLWNAAQLEMVRTGKMHGYMRMYWAKKILEWSKTPQEALKIAIRLNDKYEIDGRDPNGYTGIMWSIAGLHDRPWFKKPIFGMIRYMNRSGCEKKFDVDAYVTKFS